MKPPKPVSTEGISVPVSNDSLLMTHKHPVFEWCGLVSSFLSLCFGFGSTGGFSRSGNHEREDRGLEPEEMLLERRLRLEGKVRRQQREIDDLKRSVEELQD